jgi:uncharacterized membrane protein YecN with MAPEG domain
MPAFWAAGLGGAFALWRVVVGMMPAIAAADAGTRLGIAVASLLPATAVMLAMVLTQMLVRAGSGAVDPTAGRDGAFLVVNQRALSNTVEQMACFAPSLLALAARVGPERMTEVVALGVVFGVARLVFWVGYLRAPLLRAPGMTATFAVNVVTFGWAVRAWWG